MIIIKPLYNFKPVFNATITIKEEYFIEEDGIFKLLQKGAQVCGYDSEEIEIRQGAFHFYADLKSWYEKTITNLKK